jgi:hypothetical protein
MARSVLTDVTITPVHVELAPRRRETVTISGRRGCAGHWGGQIHPGSGVGVVDVQVLDQAWAAIACGGDVLQGQVTNSGVMCTQHPKQGQKC